MGRMMIPVCLVLIIACSIGSMVALVQLDKQEEKRAYEQELAKRIHESRPLPQIAEPEEEKLEKAEEIVEVVETYNADLELMARVVFAESDNQAFVGKVAVASTIINRSEAWGKTIEEVIFQENQYVVAETTNDECRRAVNFAWANRELFPKDMFWFTAEGYSYGYPYIHIGAHYFSTESEGLKW